MKRTASAASAPQSVYRGIFQVNDVVQCKENGRGVVRHVQAPGFCVVRFDNGSLVTCASAALAKVQS